jgi:hypothetical protein
LVLMLLVPIDPSEQVGASGSWRRHVFVAMAR